MTTTKTQVPSSLKIVSKESLGKHYEIHGFSNINEAVVIYDKNLECYVVHERNNDFFEVGKRTNSKRIKHILTSLPVFDKWGDLEYGCKTSGKKDWKENKDWYMLMSKTLCNS